MLALATAGAEEGLWLRAERQTAGRGRQGRAWSSAPGNLAVTTLVRLRPTDPPAPTLALVAGVALDEAVGVYRADGLTLKWPNDLMLAGAKLAGILLERAGDAVAIGFGANLEYHPDLPDRPTTSLAAHGVSLAPADLVETLADTFARWLGRWRSEGFAPVRTRWLGRAHPRGAALRTHDPQGAAIDGLFDGVDAEGALILRLADGTSRVIHAGDVFLL